MYARSLSNADHVRRFTITAISPSGWEVREEVDSQLVRSRRYDDWHRVERARLTFAVAADDLRSSGWLDE